MLITLKNEKISLTADTLGAQMKSILSNDGCEYLWQADPAYWGKHAPNLFPFIARLDGSKYTYMGREYSMEIHGFASKREFVCNKISDQKAEFCLESNGETKAIYPFDFTFKVIYTLCGNTVSINYRVENRGNERMYFAVGGHPGFRVPLEDGESFEDYSLVFHSPCRPDRVGFSERVLLSNRDEAYPLTDATTLPLSHSLFDDDAIIFKNMSRGITLRSKVGKRSVSVSYPDMPYLGIWHRPHTDAPYVCIEPWSSLPGRDGVLEEFTSKSDMLSLPAGEVYENVWTVTVE